MLMRDRSPMYLVDGTWYLNTYDLFKVKNVSMYDHVQYPPMRLVGLFLPNSQHSAELILPTV